MSINFENRFSVSQIPFEYAKNWILQKHYAHRLPMIKWAYGLFEGITIGSILRGVCTFGLPQRELQIGICGLQYKDLVLELNRLVVHNNEHNMASFFIAKCFKLLPKPSIIVSYSDTSMNHHGYIYQALNFLYTGLSNKSGDWSIQGMENLHSRGISELGKGQKSRKQYLRETFGGRFYTKERPRKHRYIYFLGSKKQIKIMKANLKYPILPYPKGDNSNYNASYEPRIQTLLFTRDKIFNPKLGGD